MTSHADNSSSDSNAQNRAFATTSWSMVLEASDAQASGVTDALSELCQQYWFPLYAFARRKGFDRSQAEDLTQSFFAELLSKDLLKHAEPARGRFRSFLLASFSNFIANQRRAENAQKRGGNKTVFSLDFALGEQRYSQQPTDHLTAEKIFERNWAISILEQTYLAVGSQYEQSGKRELFDQLQGFLTGDENVPYADLSKTTGMSPGALKVAVHRLRQRYGQQLRLQIAKTVQNPADVDQELQSLFRAME